MIFYVTVGGMKGTTWVQIVKAVLLMTGSALIVILVLAKFHFNLSELLGVAADNYKTSSDAAAEAAGKPRRRPPRPSWSPASSTASPAPASSTSCPSAWPWCSARRACRTS